MSEVIIKAKVMVAQHIGEVANSAREAWDNDGAEGETVHLLCDAVDLFPALVKLAEAGAIVGDPYLVCDTCGHEEALPSAPGDTCLCGAKLRDKMAPNEAQVQALLKEARDALWEERRRVRRESPEGDLDVADVMPIVESALRKVILGPSCGRCGGSGLLPGDGTPDCYCPDCKATGTPVPRFILQKLVNGSWQDESLDPGPAKMPWIVGFSEQWWRVVSLTPGARP
jgi:hypothetical protein